MFESSKSAKRRKLQDPHKWNQIFRGRGIDIGSGHDPCDRVEQWSITELIKFDQEQGDANRILNYFPRGSFDFVHSSNCLEHMSKHPWLCMADWCGLLKSGGYLIITVPDFEMYEHNRWPSQYNNDHKWAFTSHTLANSTTDNIPLLYVEDCVSHVSEAGATVQHVKRITDGWIPGCNHDQTQHYSNNIECAWEFLILKN